MEANIGLNATDESQLASHNMQESAAPSGDGALYDAAVIAGLVGGGDIDELREQLQRDYDAQIADEEAGFSQEAESLADALSASREEETDRDNQLKEVKESRATVRQRVRELFAELNRIFSQRAASFARLRARRAEYPVRMIKHRLEVQTAASSDLVEKLLVEERRLVEYEEELLSIAQRRRELNNDEYERRAAVLAASRDEAARRFTEHDELIALLRRWGVTRTIAGFLVWLGYVSFPVFGWYFGTVVRELHEKQGGGAFAGLVTLIMRGVAQLIHSVGGVWTAVILVVVPLAAVALAFGTIWAADLFLQDFDKRWKSTTAPDKKRDDSMFAWLNSPTQNARRSHYTQFLAKLPLFYLLLLAALVLAVLFSLGSPDSSQAATVSLAESPWLSVVYSSFGIVVALVLAGFESIYLARVVEPRYRRIAKSNPLPARGWIRAHLEVVVLGGVFVLLVVVSDILHATNSQQSIWAPTSTTAALLLMMLGGISAAMGLTYRGLFRDHEALLNERQAYERELQRYVGLPIIDRADEHLDRFRHELEALQREIAAAWSRADYWQQPFTALKVSATGEPEVAKPGFFARWRRQHVLSQPKSLINADELLEPELVLEILGFEQRVAELEAEVSLAHSELEALSQREAALRANDVTSRIAKLRVDLADRRRLHYQRLSDLHRLFAMRRVEMNNAYRVGDTLGTPRNRPEDPPFATH